MCLPLYPKMKARKNCMSVSTCYTVFSWDTCVRYRSEGQILGPHTCWQQSPQVHIPLAWEALSIPCKHPKLTLEIQPQPAGSSVIVTILCPTAPPTWDMNWGMWPRHERPSQSPWGRGGQWTLFDFLPLFCYLAVCLPTGKLIIVG